jgi:hypothetical protein
VLQERLHIGTPDDAAPPQGVVASQDPDDAQARSAKLVEIRARLAKIRTLRRPSLNTSLNT